MQKRVCSRKIVLDTETTGISVEKGHRVVEIGAIELQDRQPTGAFYHAYINPERAVDPGAQRVHGISNAFLKDKPLFSEVAKEFLDFLEDSELIMHNANFDTRFLNHELGLLGQPPLHTQCRITDSLAIAREKYPGSKNSLDALCKRYAISLSGRKLHGALLDAELLAQVYLFLTAEGQASLLSEALTPDTDPVIAAGQDPALLQKKITIIRANTEEVALHKKFAEAHL